MALAREPSIALTVSIVRLTIIRNNKAYHTHALTVAAGGGPINGTVELLLYLLRHQTMRHIIIIISVFIH
jgi:hypothetical protein